MGAGENVTGEELNKGVYYGQGPEHDQNPRSDKSEKIAERALGSDGKAHPPSTSGHDTSRTGNDQRASGSDNKLDRHESPAYSSSKDDKSMGAGENVTGEELNKGVYYGQGPEHDQNPRSDKSEKIAERALGSDGKAHPPSTSGHDSSRTGNDQMASGHKMFAMPGSFPSTGNMSGSGGGKVIHKCHQCGADNDISDYLKKDSS
ncbi:hypothetical protein BD289DRAFT_439932 [Coniella lustricola]|uniref:Uncharacterized protein n=1 Tax=Coniella lustricola TaxID=2025994 RepID=A0A2T3A167_9PEZI|nr:hypothetical protein BD289DRAFT_439932 [Coniella lustricola]